MIYFAQTPTGSIKIGKADDVDQRLYKLGRDFGGPLSLIHTMPGGLTEERKIHSRFKHLRFRGTEQFRPAPELMEFIGKPLLVGANPEAIEAASNAKSLLLSLPLDIHQLFRVEAAKEGLSMAAVARRLVEDYLKRKGSAK
jgi:hypothetical protein